jgi:hypothetical protein
MNKTSPNPNPNCNPNLTLTLTLTITLTPTLTLTLTLTPTLTITLTLTLTLQGAPVRDQRLVYDNVPMANERTLADYRVPRGGVLLMNAERFDGQKDMIYFFVHLLNGKTMLLNKVEVLERDIPEAMAQMSEPTERSEAAFAQARE